MNFSRDGVNRRSFLATALAGTAAAALPGLSFAQDKKFAGRSVVMQHAGGPSLVAMTELVFNDLQSETGMEIVPVPILASAAFARMKAEKDNPQIDLYGMFAGGQEAIAKAEGLTEPMDVPNMAALAPQFADAEKHWAVFGVVPHGIVYRTDKISTPPTRYQDLLKPEYQGHVLVPHFANATGTNFVVMLARELGGGEEDMDAAFEMLREFRGAAIAKTAAEIDAQLNQNDIWIAAYDFYTAFRNAKQGMPIAFAVPEVGSSYIGLASCIAKGSKNNDVASAVVNRLLSPESQIKLAVSEGWVPTNPNTVLPDELAGKFPRLDQLVQVDAETISANRSAWTERWNKEINS